jgi:hypothetical protein
MEFTRVLAELSAAHTRGRRTSRSRVVPPKGSTDTIVQEIRLRASGLIATVQRIQTSGASGVIVYAMTTLLE